ncbi:DEAD/DEAH box helicase [Telmatospirillum siberiense]|uniref:ATP-dependent helicase n=1 Tax=Telmatospirillum siberiense TaxID=382514 RepID=A0A2N3Q1N4_9PROT|nr:DEAD/DEAH box helicase [Telmatospirillum siberiense]PKU26569.1 ATP-dependent helicase [Telmatospirillum siberiense]
MPVRFSSEDLGRTFESHNLIKGRSLILRDGVVEVELIGEDIKGVVRDGEMRHAVTLTPSLRNGRLFVASHCGCDRHACPHAAATALAALDRFPILRKPQQKSFFDALLTNAETDRGRLVFLLSPGQVPFSCFVSTMLEHEGSSRIEATTPRKILGDPESGEPARALARALGGGEVTRTGIKASVMGTILGMLVASGQAKWMPTGKRLQRGEERFFARNAVPNLPPKSAVLLGEAANWYVDSASGAVGLIGVPQQTTQSAPRSDIRRFERPRRISHRSSEQAIVEEPLVPVLRLTQFDGLDGFGRTQRQDALVLDFDYAGAVTHADDERQFVRVENGAAATFVRRNPREEASALETLREDGLVQMRLAGDGGGKGRRIFLFRGQNASDRWQNFVTSRIPELERQGWRCEVKGDFGPRVVEVVGDYDLQIGDAGPGAFSVELGIEIDGVRQNLLPILLHILDHGGMDDSRIVDGQVITRLADGRTLKLPADRIRRLLATFADLFEAARRSDGKALVLPEAEAPALLDLEDLLTTRWQNAAAIQSYTEQFRDGAEIPPVSVPATFTATLRPYQQQGVDWLQHLREHSLAGLLADDMGLGKTAQTIAHITIEEEAGRLDRPVLIVVPTSLVPNWMAELGKFAPHLSTMVLHGGDRHERRERIADVQVVITTYTVLARDIEIMKHIPWHLVVLDEAQAIKSPDAKATRAVCQLDTRHKIGLSGTPVENNLGELWSEFAFLMPGLLGDRKTFNKRFRTPIEKNNDVIRRGQLARRIRPFILRRTKSEVATELPPKHVVLRRVELAPEQRELYDTIRAMLHEEVREQIAARGLMRSRIVVLDALLKLRQVCCDPRLVKLPSARLVERSSKLDDLLEMVTEMISEGRRILLFSQFTSMLDLMKPRLVAAGLSFVELRGETLDRAEPVRAFEAGEVPLFLISLKAGGRGLNLVSADTVIHYDPWWNPAVEEQASDRAHRIGQTKSVFVYKLIAAGTIEEKMVELQARKAALAMVTLGGGEDFPPIEFDDIDYLFGPGLDQQVA